MSPLTLGLTAYYLGLKYSVHTPCAVERENMKKLSS